MRRERILAVAVAIAGAVAANASFDLVLALDYNSKSIKRYDGQSGAYLGEFGKGRLVNPRFIEYGPASGEIVVTDNMDTSSGYSSIQVYDYSTGELKRQYFSLGFMLLGGIVKGASANEYYVTNSLVGQSNYSIFRVTLDPNSLATLGAVTTASHAVFGADLYRNGSTLYMGGFAGNIRVHNTSNMTFSTRLLTGMSGTSSAVGTFRYQGTNNTVAAGADARIFGVGGSPLLTTNMTNIFGLGSGHEYDYVAGYVGGVAVINVYNQGFLVGTMGQGTLSAPGDLLVIMAPEPATVAILGLGALALVRRRRRS